MAVDVYTRAGPGLGASLRVDWLSRWEAIEALRDSWTMLESRVNDRTVYASYDYVMSWYQGYASTKYTDFGEPIVGAVWESTLVGVAPLISSRSRLAGVPIRSLSLAGYNLDAGELLVLDDRSDIVEALLRSLAHRSGWDVLILGSMPSAGPRVRLIEDAARRVGLRSEVVDDHRYAVADLRDGYEAYAAAKGSNFRKQARRHAKKVSDAGDWRIDRLAGIPPPDAVARYGDRMFAIAEAGWRARERGVDEERQHHPMVRMLLQRFAPRGMVDLSILVVKDVDAAFSLALTEHCTYFHVAIAHVEEMEALSPGSFLLQEVFRIIADLGISRVVSHGDYEYKRRWASRLVGTKRLLLVAPTGRGALSWFAKFKLQAPWQRLRARDREPRPVASEAKSN